jgi:uncharacterized membrane protein
LLNLQNTEVFHRWKNVNALVHDLVSKLLNMGFYKMVCVVLFIISSKERGLWVILKKDDIILVKSHLCFNATNHVMYIYKY